MNSSISQLVTIATITIATTAVYAMSPNNAFGSSVLTYENPDYAVGIDYPTTWKTEEIDLEPRQVVRIIPNDFIEEYESPVRFSIAVVPALDLSEAIGAIEILAKNSSDARFVNSTNTTLAGIPAYSISYYDYTSGKSYKVIDTMTVLDNELFHLQYNAEPGYFNQYLPDAKRMIDSFNITKVSNNSRTF
jgi:hypothetical protein